ncbi:DUF4388 domain-containing protein [Deinococcus navajonensis]|uniref:DUF4388 domain-containing protein n=1 Tax=Deinococcus navajonensis TaxID=309884 RepID=A0ABV8XSF5_9DEIO
MLTSTVNLDTYDFLELLYLLSEQRRSGVLQVVCDDGQFYAWMRGGRVQAMQFGQARGAAALSRLLRDPRGQSTFLPGPLPETHGLDTSLDELAFEALEELPVGELPFEGPGRLTSPERIAALRWTLRERQILQQIEAQRPMVKLAREADAARLITKLSRVGLLVAQRSRLARLTLTVTRQVRGVVLVDEMIWQRWGEGRRRPLERVALRNEAGAVHTLSVRPAPSLGRQLMIPPELLLQTGLYAGDSVLVQPF